MSEYTIEEQIVCSIARSFKPDDDFTTVGMNPSGMAGLALAKELYAPKISLVSILQNAEGRFGVLSQIRLPFIPGCPPEDTVETTLGMEEIFSLVVRGKYLILMQPVQLDQYGYTNLSLVGDKNAPSAVFVGSRGMPDNSVNMPRTIYFIPSHSKRIFVEKVDFISGIGYGKERTEGYAKWGDPVEVISNLGIIDFDKTNGRARLKSVYNGITPEQVQENTGFELIVPDQPPYLDPPTDEELHWIREVIDPLGVRRLDYLRGEAYQKVMQEIMSAG